MEISNASLLRCDHQTEVPNIKIQRTGAEIALVATQLPPAADLGRSKVHATLIGVEWLKWRRTSFCQQNEH